MDFGVDLNTPLPQVQVPMNFAHYPELTPIPYPEFSPTTFEPQFYTSAYQSGPSTFTHSAQFFTSADQMAPSMSSQPTQFFTSANEPDPLMFCQSHHPHTLMQNEVVDEGEDNRPAGAQSSSHRVRIRLKTWEKLEEWLTTMPMLGGPIDPSILMAFKTHKETKIWEDSVSKIYLI